MKFIYITMFVFIISLSSFAQLRLEAEDSTYFLFEPIYIYIEYQGKSPISSTNPEYEQVKLTTTNIETKEERNYIPAANFDGAVGKIPENYAISSIVSISSDRLGWVFPKEGTYIIKASVPDFQIQSDPITITIVKPTAAIDLEICNKLAACRNMAKFIKFEGGDMYEDALALSENIANGISSYKLSFSGLVSKNYCQRLYSRKNGFREPDLEKAMTFMSPINEQITAQSKVYIMGHPSNARFLNHVRTLAFLNRISKINKSNVHDAVIKNEIMEFRTRYRNVDLDHLDCSSLIKN